MTTTRKQRAQRKERRVRIFFYKLALITIWSIFLISLFNSTIEACSCLPFPNAKEALDEATDVFQGTVVQRVTVLTKYEDLYYPIERYTFAVERRWKGKRSKEIIVYEGVGNCSNWFTTGQTYLVYAIPHETLKGELYSEKCSLTKEAAFSKEDLVQIGKGEFMSAVHSSKPGLFKIMIYDLRASFLVGLAHAEYQVFRSEKVSSLAKFTFAVITVIMLSLLLLMIRAVRSRKFALILIYILISTLSFFTILYVTGSHVIRDNNYLHHLLQD